MSYYVKRQKLGSDEVKYTGPIRSVRQAGREANAWLECGYAADILHASDHVRGEVRAWAKARKALYGDTP